MMTTSLPLTHVNRSAGIKIGLVALFIVVVTLGGVISLDTNLTTTYSTNGTSN